ncbi:MAG: EpsG family protein [Clostridiales bacterium]|nr:EpsG family protein [Clostridiales bacterium]
MLVYTIATALTLAAVAWLYPKREMAEISTGMAGTVKRSVSADTRKKLILSCVVAMIPFLAVMSARWCVGVDTWFTYTPEYLAMKSESVPLTEEEEQIMLTSGQITGRLAHGYSKEKAMELTLEEAYSNFRLFYHHTGIGFQGLQRILVFFHADVQWLYFVTSLIILGLVFTAIWQQSSYPLLACLFFVITGNFFLSMNIVSQYIAIAICLFACTFAEKRKPIWFFLLVALAATVHISALVFLLVYFLPKLKIKPLWCIVAVAVALLVAQFAFPLIKKLVEIVAPQYVRHFEMSADFEWVFFGIGCAVLALGTCYFNKGKDFPYFRLWYYMNVLGLIALAFSGNIPLMKRINYYFAASHILLLPMLMNLEEDKKKRIGLHILTIGLFTAQIVVAIWHLNKHATLPYRAFFQGNRLEMMLPMLDHIPGLW